MKKIRCNKKKETHIPQAQRQTIHVYKKVNTIKIQYDSFVKRALRMSKPQDKTTTRKKNRHVSEEKKKKI